MSRLGRRRWGCCGCRGFPSPPGPLSHCCAGRGGAEHRDEARFPRLTPLSPAEAKRRRVGEGPGVREIPTPSPDSPPSSLRSDPRSRPNAATSAGNPRRCGSSRCGRYSASRSRGCGRVRAAGVRYGHVRPGRRQVRRGFRRAGSSPCR